MNGEAIVDVPHATTYYTSVTKTFMKMKTKHLLQIQTQPPSHPLLNAPHYLRSEIQSLVTKTGLLSAVAKFQSPLLL